MLRVCYSTLLLVVILVCRYADLWQATGDNAVITIRPTITQTLVRFKGVVQVRDADWRGKRGNGREDMVWATREEGRRGKRGRLAIMQTQVRFKGVVQVREQGLG